MARRPNAGFVLAACACFGAMLAGCGSPSGPSNAGTGTSGPNGVVNPCTVLTASEADQLTGGAILTGSPEATDINGQRVLTCFYAPADQDPNIVARIDITQGVSRQSFESTAGVGQPSVHAVSGIGVEAFEEEGSLGSGTNVYSGAVEFLIGTGQVSIAVSRRGGPVDLATLEADARTAATRLGSSFGTGTVAPSPTTAPLPGGPAQMTFTGEMAGSAAGKAQCFLTGGTYNVTATMQVTGQSGPTDVMVTYSGYTPGGSSTYQVGVDSKLVVNAGGPSDKWLTMKGGSVTIHGDAKSGGGSLDVMLHDGGAIEISGTWSCS